MPKIKHPQHRSCFSCIYKDEILRPVKKSYVCPFNFSSQFPILNHILVWTQQSRTEKKQDIKSASSAHD